MSSYLNPRYRRNPYASRAPQRAALWLVVVGVLCLCVYFVIRFQATPPAHFPLDTDVVIEAGQTQSEIVDVLHERGVIRSPLLLRIILKRSFGDKFVLAGTYQFPAPLTAHAVAEAVTQGTYRTSGLVLTLPEGFSVQDMEALMPDGYTHDINTTFVAYEGYLFPDTYFITNEMTPTDILALLRKTMTDRLEPYTARREELGLSVEELLIFASILEREANDEVSMKLVSGILHSRLAIGMPLQVDATFDYILGKTSAELTLDDLAIDSPYNTYTNRGLPPTPIANPGIMAIEAALYPQESDHLYYLTSDAGVFYYAETFEEHVRNKELYLR